jgi:hypothetical protein
MLMGSRVMPERLLVLTNFFICTDHLTIEENQPPDCLHVHVAVQSKCAKPYQERGSCGPLADLPRYGRIPCEYTDRRELEHIATDGSDTIGDGVHVNTTGGERLPPEPGQSSGFAWRGRHQRGMRSQLLPCWEYVCIGVRLLRSRPNAFRPP